MHCVNPSVSQAVQKFLISFKHFTLIGGYYSKPIGFCVVSWTTCLCDCAKGVFVSKNHQLEFTNIVFKNIL